MELSEAAATRASLSDGLGVLGFGGGLCDSSEDKPPGSCCSTVSRLMASKKFVTTDVPSSLGIGGQKDSLSGIYQVTICKQRIGFHQPLHCVVVTRSQTDLCQTA